MNATLLRSAFYIAAICGLYLAAAMFVPAMADLYYANRDWQVFAICGFMVGGISAVTAVAMRGNPPPFSRRLGFFLVNLLWVTFALVGSIPLYLAGPDLSFAQSLFESVSAITTTGSTVLTGLDHMAPGLLLWRSLLQWMGGIGIVALGLFILPFLRIGGMAFFKMESSDTSDKPFARMASFTRAFLAIYVGITIVCAISYDVAGMSHFDAVNHALTTVATGGFSTHDASFGYFDNPELLWIAAFFMTVCSLPFSILILFIVRGRLDTLRDPQIMLFLMYLLIAAFLLALYISLDGQMSFTAGLTQAIFNVSSVLSTTGYASADYMTWGSFAIVMVFFLMFMGGCSGSTAGGIKSYRFLVLFNMLKTGLKKLIYPNAVYSVRYGTLTVDSDTQRAVSMFFSAYILLWAVGSIAMAALGYDLITSTSAVLTALSNVGPGLGDIIGPAGNFSTMADPELLLLTVLMLLGRLEILTVVVILMPMYWRG
ncbi:TrkH family potassium uptake protein [Martelella mediterranea]|uniref:Trk system potassium uptake protein n=1 Tax=Martelella mediterranea TaxID=293089 RepID=A0A4R3NK49_9HYPH|nr:TrkH family potassium uptake protein [Martelella mediterranea]TCT35191.1 trk system potassium uptake protein TrkH [Martelella mediterranea]